MTNIPDTMPLVQAGLSNRATYALLNEYCPITKWDPTSRTHVRITNPRNRNTVTVGEIRRLPDNNILRIRNIGKVTFHEIRKKLGTTSYSLVCPYCGHQLP